MMYSMKDWNWYVINKQYLVIIAEKKNVRQRTRDRIISQLTNVR